ncbi:hypothetical protein, partial [Serratia marcescens]|uniref:hypothetical protein n=1 Tax=Serratia marcescens TaxID=615 RepID=UPI00195530EA
YPQFWWITCVQGAVKHLAGVKKNRSENYYITRQSAIRRGIGVARVRVLFMLYCINIQFGCDYAE